MNDFQPPPPLLPDLIHSPLNIPPPVDPTTSINCYQKQQVVTGNSYHESNSPHSMQTILPGEENVVQMMMDCNMGANSEYSSGLPSTNWTPNAPSSSSSTVFNDHTRPRDQHMCPLPPPPNEPMPQPRHSISQPPQLPDMGPEKVVDEFEKIMRNENDKVVLTNSILLLFRFSIDTLRGPDVCQAMSASPDIMNRLYYVLKSDQFKNEEDSSIQCYATGNLANISKYEEGRITILGLRENFFDAYHFNPSHGVESLIQSLKSKDSNIVIFAITAIHNLLLDRRVEIQEIAKEQIKHGIGYIVQLLDDQKCKMNNYEFKMIVLDCLQILAYGNGENRLAIKESGGPVLILRTIDHNLTNPTTEELIELIDTASRVLKSLSACAANKMDIINNGGIGILTQCIERNNREVLKTCLWTLRNLSDLINNSGHNHGPCINHLVERLLQILREYAGESCIIACALGILANITCNNESIKHFICQCKGVELLLETIAMGDGCDFLMVDREILEPAICALCHLMNQSNHDTVEYVRRIILRNMNIFTELMNQTMDIDSSKAITKLVQLTERN